jgi:hypothetical protein
MGFFSWRTQDTDRSIANNYSTRKTLRNVCVRLDFNHARLLMIK